MEDKYIEIIAEQQTEIDELNDKIKDFKVEIIELNRIINLTK